MKRLLGLWLLLGFSVAGAQYKNCTEAAKYGSRDMSQGQYGYSDKLDRDGDGVACESGGDDTYDLTKTPFYLPSNSSGGTTPSKGIFSGPVPQQIMQSAVIALPPNLKPFAVTEILQKLGLKGVLNYSTQNIQLIGAEPIAGQEQAIVEFLKWLLPPQTVVYLEPTGNYSNNRPEGQVWLGRSLLSVVLVERGLALPQAGSKYTAELAQAIEFAKKNKLGAYASAP